jgi:fibronectin type 3 domain-containing protein
MVGRPLPPHRRAADRPAMRRLAIILAALPALLAPAQAGAYWSASGSGTGAATVDTLATGTTPTTSVSGRTVTVSWAQTNFHGGLLGTFSGGRYTVRRYLSTGGGAITPAGTCAATVTGSAATLSCTDTNVSFGLWRYTVTPELTGSWTATESPKSGVTTVVPIAPTVTAASGTAGRIDLSWPAVNGASGYNVYRRTTGSFDYGSPLNGGTPVSGTAYADLATTNGTTYGYVLRAVAASANGGTLESADSNEAAALADAAGPSVVLSDPGSAIRGTVALAASATDTGSGVAGLLYQYTAAGGSSWTTACTGATTPFGCPWATTGVADGVYDLRVVATDAVGNTTTSATVAARAVDNTRPTGTDIQSANVSGGTASLAEAGDTVTFTFSEAIAPASVLAGWSGATTPVTVRISAAASGVLTVHDSANTSQLPLGSVSLGMRYGLTALTFSNSTMVRSGSTITVTLGTLALGGVQSLGTGTGTLSWTTVPTPTDLAGNTLTAATITESGTADRDF